LAATSIYTTLVALQAYAALYQWDADFSLDKDPFRKVSGTKVLDTITRFAARYKLEESTCFLTEALNVQRVAHDRCSAGANMCMLWAQALVANMRPSCAHADSRSSARV
jgi:hypothetical protein